MYYINKHVINIFTPRFCINRYLTSSEMEEYEYLCRAIRFTRCYSGCGNVEIKIGDKIKTKTEFYSYPDNIIVLLSENGKDLLQIFEDGKVGKDCGLNNDEFIKKFIERHKHDFVFMDNYGHRPQVNDYHEFCKYRNFIVNIRKSNKSNTEAYHKFMIALSKFRNQRTSYPDSYINVTYDNLVTLANEFAGELRDILITLDEQNDSTLNSFTIVPSEEEKTVTIFGLYLAVLKAYVMEEYEYEPLSLEEKTRICFFKEFNFYLQENEKIIDRYCQYFNIPKSESQAINNLLDKEGLFSADFVFDSSELSF